MKITLGVWMRNAGDGSCFPIFFSSEKEAENVANKIEEQSSYDLERYCDDIMSVTIEVDENGKLLNTPYFDEDGDLVYD